ncbi:hypothetical protein CEK25_008094 [Fusarium fujikuroi]|nr:hypothetical protein CEK25_008094 [Fusarium fujikuroi]
MFRNSTPSLWGVASRACSDMTSCSNDIVKDTFDLADTPRNSNVLVVKDTFTYRCSALSSVFLGLDWYPALPRNIAFDRASSMGLEQAQFLLSVIGQLQLGYDAIMISFQVPTDCLHSFGYGMSLAGTRVSSTTEKLPFVNEPVSHGMGLAALYMANSYAPTVEYAPRWFVACRFPRTARLGTSMVTASFSQAMVKLRYAISLIGLRAKIARSAITAKGTNFARLEADHDTNWEKLEAEEKTKAKEEEEKKKEAEKKKKEEEKKGKKKDGKGGDKAKKDDDKNKASEEGDKKNEEKSEDNGDNAEKKEDGKDSESKGEGDSKDEKESDSKDESKDEDKKSESDEDSKGDKDKDSEESSDEDSKDDSKQDSDKKDDKQDKSEDNKKDKKENKSDEKKDDKSKGKKDKKE